MSRSGGRASLRDGRASTGPARVPTDDPLGRARPAVNVTPIRTARSGAVPRVVSGPGAGPGGTAANLLLDLRIPAERLVARAPGADPTALRSVPGSVKVEARGERIEATLRDAHRNLAALLAAVPHMESVEVRAPTLNDVFLRTTGRALRGEGEGEGWRETMLKASQRPS